MSNEPPTPEGVHRGSVPEPERETSPAEERAATAEPAGSVAEQLVVPRESAPEPGRLTEVSARGMGDEPVAKPGSPDTVAEAQEPPPRPATSAASMQTVYVPAPVPPIKKGNRGFGVLIALLSTVVFAGLYALVIATIRAVEVGVFQFDFFGSLAFYTPAIFFFVGFVIVVVFANRASWWSYVLGSLFVGLFVYFGTVGTGLLVNNVLGETATEAARLLATALSSPFIIGAALVAREVSMWMGAFISARGRKVKARNIDARETFDSESAARTSEYEKSRYGTPEATA